MNNLSIKYIFTSPSLKGSSVQNKVINQIKYLNKAGANCEGVFLSSEVSEITPLNEFINLIPVKKCKWKYFRSIGQKHNIDKAIHDYIQRYYLISDILYFRFPGSSFLLYKISKKFGKKIISEHQSKEYEEIKSLANNNVFGIKPSKFLSWFQYNFVPIFNEKLFGRLFVKNIAGVVAVTKEIGEYQKNKGAKKVIVIPNGINVKSYDVKKNIDLNSPLKIIFLKGTSTNAPWNGLDRLIDSIDNILNPHQKIKLLICGHIINGEIPKRSYVEIVGYKNKLDIDQLIQEVHIGVSTLSLYKKELKEASTLKTREYIARGLPFFYAYTDPDLNEESKEFALEFSNDDSLIDMEKVIEFAKKALQDKDLPQKMRKYAEDYLDYEVKMKQLYINLESLIK